MHHMKKATESSLQNKVLKKDRMKDNVQNFGSYINIRSSQTYRSYNQAWHVGFLILTEK
jgi:hypothetical protein